jgi:hypothetical protein
MFQMLIVACCLSVARAAEIYTSVTGTRTDLCHILAPCSFDVARRIVATGDIVYVKGSYIGESDDLEQLQALFNAVLAEGAVIMSDNMTVNGSNYRHSKEAFIVVQSAADSRIHRFHFTGFETTIACFRRVEKGVISESTFSRNHIRGGIGMLVFGVGKCKLDFCNLTENSVDHTSMIGMFSTHLYLNLTIIERNWVTHESRQALMFAINSVCEYTNTTIRHNHSPFAPLHQFEFRSCFGFWNCTFEENKHPELMLCDGTCEFNFTNATVTRNMGSFLTTGLNSSVTLNDSVFQNNFSGVVPLFDIPGSHFLIVQPCKFLDNVGVSLVDLRGSSGRVDLVKAEFSRNRVKEFVIGADSASGVYLTQTRFSDNAAGVGTVFAENSTLLVNRSRFGREVGFALRILEGKATIADNAYRNNTRAAVKAAHSEVTITGGTFRGELIGGNIDTDRPPKMQSLIFTSAKRSALRPDLLQFCRGCSYGGESDGLLQIALLISATALSAATAWLFRPGIARWTQTVWNPKEL